MTDPFDLPDHELDDELDNEPSRSNDGAGFGADGNDESSRGTPRSRVEIEYCTQCRWLLRAAWMAQELLATFEPQLGEVALLPGTGGVFDVRVDGETVWSRADHGRFPELKQLKQLVRDRVAPNHHLGHADR